MRRNLTMTYNDETSVESETSNKNVYPLLECISDGLEDEGEATKKYFDLLNVLFEYHEDETICDCDYAWLKKEIEEIISEENKHSITLLNIIEKLSGIRPESHSGGY